MRNKLQICGNIIASSPDELTERVQVLESCPHIDIVHLDVMDGLFVRNKSLDFLEDYFKLPELKKQKKYHLHLMVHQPRDWISDMMSLNPNFIHSIDTFIIHYESADIKDLREALMSASWFGKAGLAINPKTPVSEINYLITFPYKKRPLVSSVCVLGVEPGQYNALYDPSTLKKAEEIRKIRDSICPIDVIADGAVNDKSSKKLYDAGYNILASGSYVMKNPDKLEPDEAARIMRENITRRSL